MNLVLEIEFLSGVSFAALSPDSSEPDWPPQPDRIFSALVAAWAARGQRDDEAHALEWLEAQPVPRLIASRAEPRIVGTVFVPPNDPRSNRKAHALGVIPAFRSRQPRHFPAVRPHDPIVRLIWVEAHPEKQVFDALVLVARDTAYVGHSTSLTRCRFSQGEVSLESSHNDLSTRSVYKGRFAELRENFKAGRRPLPGAHLRRSVYVSEGQTNFFGDRWLLLEHVGGEMPDLRACALVAKTIRNAILSGYRRIGLGSDIPEVVSGHFANGQVARSHHLAIVPLPFAGFPYADGHVMGFALIPPRHGELFGDENFLSAMRRQSPQNEQLGRRVLNLKTKEGTSIDRAFSLDLSPTIEVPPGKRSLDPALYTEPAKNLASLTPIVLDRHLKRKGEARQEEIQAQILSACRNIGLPKPKEIIVGNHSAIEGVPPAYPAAKSPAWMHWRLPHSIASRQLTHAVIRFASPVNGPVILGSGRFMGLGLFRSIDG